MAVRNFTLRIRKILNRLKPMAMDNDNRMGTVGKGVLKNIPTNAEIIASPKRMAIRIELERTNLRESCLSSSRINVSPDQNCPIMLNMGRYMATMTAPTSPPRNRIMIGSIREIKAETDCSTSSS